MVNNIVDKGVPNECAAAAACAPNETSSFSLGLWMNVQKKALNMKK